MKQLFRRPHKRAGTAFCLALLLGAPGAAAAPGGPDHVPAQFVATSKQAVAPEQPAWPVFAGKSVPVALSLPPAAQIEAGQLQAVTDWNRGSGRPLQNGIVRVFSSAIRFDLGPESRLALAELGTPQSFGAGWLAAEADGRTLYTTSVRVDSAWRLRLKLADVRLPDGARLWVAGGKGSVSRAFGPELAGPDRSLWTPSVAGEQIRLVLSLPGAMPDAGFSLVAVGEMFRLAADGSILTPGSVLVDLSCRQDAWCLDQDDWAQIGVARSAVALLNYVKNGALKQCSGGLVADSDPATAVPYLVTAHHCIDSQDAASTLEAWWDYGTGACGGAAPDPETLPVSLGATLLATGERGDFTLLQLSAAPGSRWFLGWDLRPEATVEGTLLHRISHPRGRPHSYSSSLAGGNEYVCDSWPPRQSIYQTQLSGLIAGGSSGAPVLSDQALLLGQATGLCGSNAGQSCNLDNAVVDGALRSYWPEVAPWLAPRCTYQLQEPASGSQWARGSELTIRWSASGYGCGEAVKLRLLRNGERVGVISAGAPNNGSHVWQIPPGRSTDSAYSIELIDGQDKTLRARSDGQFSIVERLGSPQCRYQIQSPAEAEVLTRGQVYSLQWTSDGADCGDDLRLRLLREGQRVGVIARLTGDDGEFEWLVPPGRAPGARYRVRLVAAADDSQRATSGLFEIVKP